MIKIKSIIAAATLTFCSHAQSASVSYNLDQSNVLADGIAYLMVTISDSVDHLGDIDFRIETTSAFNAGANFGIQAFGFNPSLKIASENIYGLDNTWKIGASNMGGFGSFAVTESGTGNSRENPLTFSINVAGDSINSYANPSSGSADSWVGLGSPYFSAHVAGFISDLSDAQGKMVTSGFFAGNATSISPTVVPVPAAVWLLGSGLIGMVGVSRRKKIT